MLKKLNDGIERIIAGASFVLLSAFIVVVFLQVLARNYLKISLIWTDEVAVMAFVWSVFLGAAVAVRRGKHYVVEVLPAMFARTNALLNVFADLVILFFVYVMVRYGTRFTVMGLSRFSTAIMIPRFYYFVAVPLSGVVMVLFQVEVLIADVATLVSALREAHGERVPKS